MVRSFLAAWLLVALATGLTLRADEENPLRPLPHPGNFTLLRDQTSVRVVTHLDDVDGFAPIVDGPPASPPREVLPTRPDTFADALRPPEKSWPDSAVEPGVAVQPELVEVPAELSWYHYWARACSPHHDPNDPERHFGLGEPLLNTSWRNRPLYLNVFAGGLIGDELQLGLIAQGGGFIAGGRFGGDFDHYWGLETRLAFSSLNTEFAAGGYGQSFDSFFDASLLYYPWGDSRWRPYLTLGLGMAHYRYETAAGTKVNAGAMAVPWGVGMKFLFRPDVALRFDLIDNFSFEGGSRSDMMHNVSFTGGIELRFGGRRTSYGSW